VAAEGAAAALAGAAGDLAGATVPRAGIARVEVFAVVEESARRKCQPMSKRISAAIAPAIHSTGRRSGAGSTGRTMRCRTVGAGPIGSALLETGRAGAAPTGEAGDGACASAEAADGFTFEVAGVLSGGLCAGVAGVRVGCLVGGAVGGVSTAAIWRRPQTPLMPLRMISLKGAGMCAPPGIVRCWVRD
jgi:hypothetical protein